MSEDLSGKSGREILEDALREAVVSSQAPPHDRARAALCLAFLEATPGPLTEGITSRVQGILNGK